MNKYVKTIKVQEGWDKHNAINKYIQWIKVLKGLGRGRVENNAIIGSQKQFT